MWLIPLWIIEEDRKDAWNEQVNGVFVEYTRSCWFSRNVLFYFNTHSVSAAHSEEVGENLLWFHVKNLSSKICKISFPR